MKPKVYVVHAYRYGDREMHSYGVGVYSKKAQALRAAEKEEDLRGGNKYVCEVIEITMDVQPALGEHGHEKTIKGLPAINLLKQI